MVASVAARQVHVAMLWTGWIRVGSSKMSELREELTIGNSVLPTPDELARMRERFGNGEGPWLEGTPEGTLLWDLTHKPWWYPRWLFFWVEDHKLRPFACERGDMRTVKFSRARWRRIFNPPGVVVHEDCGGEIREVLDPYRFKI